METLKIFGETIKIAVTKLNTIAEKNSEGLSEVNTNRLNTLMDVFLKYTQKCEMIEREEQRIKQIEKQIEHDINNLLPGLTK